MKPNTILRTIVAAALTVLPLTAQFLRHVDARVATGGDGSTWASAYRTLDAALAEARGALVGYEVWIWIAAGEYSPGAASGGLVAPHWELPGTVSVYGGFAGFETNLRERDIDAHEVVLDGHLRSGTIRARGALLSIDGGEPLLDGLTIRGCDRDGDGAALVVRSGTPALSRCTFVDNLAAGSGGAIAVLGDSLTCSDCVFRRNSAAVHGGAVYSTSAGRVEFDSCEFVLNIGGEDGGAVLAAGGAVLTDCSFSDNASGADGGAVCSRSTTSWLSVSDCRFASNLALGQGGAILQVEGTYGLGIQRTVFAGNHAQRGGALYVDSFHRIFNSAFTGNEAQFEGGGIYSARTESGSYDSGCDHCTFHGNRAYSGGGIFVLVGDAEFILASIFWANEDETGGNGFAQQMDGDLRAARISRCCIQSWTRHCAGTDCMARSPRFRDAFGPDGIAGSGDEDLRLDPGSPCVDASMSAAGGELGYEDCNGQPRGVDGDGNGTVTCDLGAFELQR